MPGYSLIILHHNKAAYSRACLESVLCTAARPLQVINVDNGSTDGTNALLDEWEVRADAAGIEVMRMSYGLNIGAVRGRNVALKMAEGDYIGFLDNDTVVAQPNWLDLLRASLSRHPRCGIVAPRLLFPWAPHLVECCGCAVTPAGRIIYLERGAPSGTAPAEREVQCAISAAWLMPRALVDSVGGLDEAFSPVQYDDLDFCYRARAAGWSVFTQPQCVLYHFEHTTTAGSGDINFAYVTTKNGLLFKKRWESTFHGEAAAGEAEAAWLNLPKKTVREVNWEALLPAAPGEKGSAS
jgi:GT2 family glycosyltransferase